MRITLQKALYRYLDQILSPRCSNPMKREASHRVEIAKRQQYQYFDRENRECYSISKNKGTIGIWIKNPRNSPREGPNTAKKPPFLPKKPIAKPVFEKRTTPKVGKMAYPTEESRYRYLDQEIIGIWIKFEPQVSVFGSKNIGIWIKILSVFGSSQNGVKFSSIGHFFPGTINVLIYLITLTLTQRSFKNSPYC